MKKVLALALVAVAALTACSSSSGYTSQSADEFATTISSTPGVVVLDVRTPGEFAAGHLPNAINIDVEGGSFDEQIASLDKNATYAVYCHSGRRSGIASTTMVDAGFSTIFNLDGGLLSWTGSLVTN
jgi:rhodanese-related sulfurtransferase